MIKYKMRQVQYLGRDIVTIGLHIRGIITKKINRNYKEKSAINGKSLQAIDIS